MAETYSKKTSLRLPPQDLEAEQALLGSLMLKPQGIDEIIDHISESSFYAEKHRLIYRTMLDLHRKNDPIDLLSLSARLKDKKLLEQIGGASYISTLVEIVPSSGNLKHYAHIVERKSALRNLIESAEEVLEMGYDSEDELDEIFDKAEKKIFGIKNTSLKQSFTSLKDELSEAWERLDRLHKSKGAIRGVETGFSELDQKLAGLQKSDLVILAARPSMGKTSLALDTARQTATKYGNAVGIFSLEMSSQQLVDRMLAGEAHVDSWKLRTGKITNDEEFGRISEALDRLSRSPIFIDDESSNNIIKMRAMARRLKSECNLKIIIVDYLQLMIPNRQSYSLVQQVTEIS